MLKVRGNLNALKIGLGTVLGVSAAASCKYSPPTDSISVDLVRSGHEITQTAFQYTDNGPTITDDGAHIVFLSGRDSTTSTPMIKAYKSDWATGKGPGTVLRVTQSDIGYEQDARVSPDGNWILLQVVHNNQTDLFLQAYSGTPAPVQITNNTNSKTSYQFSSDSALISWIERDEATATAVAKVATIGNGSASSVATATTISPSADYVTQLFWIPTAGSYTLVTGVSSAATPSVITTYKQYSFTAPTASAKESDWFTKFNAKLSVPPVAAANITVVVEGLSNLANSVANPLQAPQVGDGLIAIPPIGAPMRSAPVYVATPANSSPGRYTYIFNATTPATNPPPGFDVSSVSLTADGSTAFMVGRFYYRCYGDTQDSFGSSFVIAPTDATKPFSYFNPKLTATPGEAEAGYVEAYSYSAPSICQNRGYQPNGPTFRIDDQMTTAAVNRNATTSTYRLVYVTRSVMHFDGACNLLAGNPQVWVLDVSPSGQTFYPISLQQAPITDDDRGDQGVCVF